MTHPLYTVEPALGTDNYQVKWHGEPTPRYPGRVVATCHDQATAARVAELLAVSDLVRDNWVARGHDSIPVTEPTGDWVAGTGGTLDIEATGPSDAMPSTDPDAWRETLDWAALPYRPIDLVTPDELRAAASALVARMTPPGGTGANVALVAPDVATALLSVEPRLIDTTAPGDGGLRRLALRPTDDVPPAVVAEYAHPPVNDAANAAYIDRALALLRDAQPTDPDVSHIVYKDDGSGLAEAMAAHPDLVEVTTHLDLDIGHRRFALATTRHPEDPTP